MRSPCASPPPAAAYSHSASVGNRPLSHAQNANASYQLTQFIGSRSFIPLVFHVWLAPHCTAVASAIESAAMEAFQSGDFQPLPAISGWAPASFAGGPA